MAQEPATIYEALHRYLASTGIETVEEFFGDDELQTRKRLVELGAEISAQCFIFGVHNGFLKMPDLNRTDDFEPFRPLITVLLANEAKCNEEMCDLIDQESNRPPTPLAFVPAPVKTSTTSGLVDSSSKLEDFLHPLRQELTGLLYTNVPGLVEHFINKQHIDPAFRLEPTEYFIDKKHNEKLENTRQHPMLSWITSFVEQLEKQSSNIRQSRTWRNLPDTCLVGVDEILKLDGAIMSRVKKNKKGYHIQDVLVPFELKKDKSLATQAVTGLAKYVCEVFKSQPTRSFVVGVTLCGTLMQLWQFDRSGAIGSESVDLKADKKNLAKFFDLMLCFLKCNKQLLGFDPTFIEAQDRRHLEMRIPIKNGNQELVIDSSHIFRASGICGRGTTCWEAHLSEDKSQKFMIKDSWQPKQRPEEGEMLRKVNKKNLPHVVRYHHHEDVCVDGKIVDIESHVRRGPNFQNCQKIPINEKPDDPNVQNEFINRVHRQLILKDVGQPIWKVDSPLRLLEALEGCITGHQALFDAGILHRDISINNLMVNNDTKDADRKSFLIDLDVAIRYPTRNDEDLHARTGTKVFMSIGLLFKLNTHTHVDDLESFFWVFIWICIHYPDDQRKGLSEVTHWNQYTPEGLGASKSGYLTHPGFLTKHFTPQYQQSQPLLDCVTRFAKIMSNEQIREQKSAILYQQILKNLQQAQEELRKEDKLSQL
ncbi:FunK1 12 [Puccinia graminis f. sp. tritici CRL 75-36-700-3]|uniref:FunK1 12 n=1 Tax=Puccinia graminis f. sp. tritici (strain CRL 75-36-700-3 / race SCCL) TaxID=418459 RepID=E3L8X6_PUCGT|nr:FunK1 12 [Puccinia graminis f. sp. tritici CRL 75-36-700-3]EFP93001.1 FunK1 12 [Puccinia graminis f. sp. tritici CRL 75-36-700-3]